jgi:hypothetical protein
MFRTFSKQVRKKAGELTFLITLTVTGECSEKSGLNFVFFSMDVG